MIVFLGKIYMDDTLIATHLELTTPEAILEELHNSANAWSLILNSTGAAINPEKSR